MDRCSTYQHRMGLPQDHGLTHAACCDLMLGVTWGFFEANSGYETISWEYLHITDAQCDLIFWRQVKGAESDRDYRGFGMLNKI